jgi:hypothetical protein
VSERLKRRQMREQGYRDGRVGLPARWLDADYQRAWRDGQNARRQEEASHGTKRK